MEKNKKLQAFLDYHKIELKDYDIRIVNAIRELFSNKKNRKQALLDLKDLAVNGGETYRGILSIDASDIIVKFLLYEEFIK